MEIAIVLVVIALIFVVRAVKVVPQHATTLLNVWELRCPPLRAWECRSRGASKPGSSGWSNGHRPQTMSARRCAPACVPTPTPRQTLGNSLVTRAARAVR